MNDSRMLTVDEVAQRLGISKHMVYRRIARTDIKAVEVRKPVMQYLIAESDLEAYIANGGELTPPQINNRAMLRVPEVAQILGFTTETIRRMCYEGQLPYVRGAGVRGHLRVPRQAVESFKTAGGAR